VLGLGIDPSPVDIEPFGDVNAHGAQRAARLECLAPFHDAGQRFVRAHAQNFLRNNRSLVEIGGDEMGGNSDHFHAPFISLAVSVGAWESRQEGGMDIDDLVFPAPNEIRGKNFHEPRQDDEIGLVFFEKLQDLLFGPDAVVEGNMMERKFFPTGERFQSRAITDDDDGLRPEFFRRQGEQSFENVRFFRNQNSQPLRAFRGEMDFRFHAEIAGRRAYLMHDSGTVEARGGPRCLERHAELAACDLFFHGFDVGAKLKEELGDARDDAGFVPPDKGQSSKIFLHFSGGIEQKGYRLAKLGANPNRGIGAAGFKFTSKYYKIRIDFIPL